MVFEKRVSWHLVISDSNSYRRLCTLVFAGDDKIVELVKRSGGLTNLESKQALERGIDRQGWSVSEGHTGAICKATEGNTPMRTEALLELWNLEDIPACDEGMELAKSFLVSCGEAVEKADAVDTITLRSQFDFRFNRYAAHRAICPKCNEG